MSSKQNDTFKTVGLAVGDVHDTAGSIFLTELLKELNTLGRDAFRQTWGDGFLLFQGVESEFKAPDRLWRQTIAAGERRIGQQVLALDTMPVLPVRYTGRSSSPLFVTIGRSPGSNDVVLTDESVSSFHAYFQRNRSREFELVDAGSKNGTYLNDRPVSRNEPVRVNSGDRVRCGSVVMTFLDVEGLAAFGTSLAHFRSRPPLS